MLRIVKRAPPDCIRVLRETPGADWGSVTGAQKAEMRAALLAEQGELCAYCMRRVDAAEHTCTVEHWRARSAPGTDPFTWSDLLAVCDGGGPGRDRRETYCDRFRGNAPLKQHPAHPTRDVERGVAYEADGTIVAEDAEALNLNHATLMRNRRQVVDVVLQLARNADATQLRRMLDTWRGRVDDRRKPYAGVAIYFLAKRLRVVETRSGRTRKVPRTRRKRS